MFFCNQNRFVAHWPLTELSHQIYAKSPHSPQANHPEDASAATPHPEPATLLTPSPSEGSPPKHPAQTDIRPALQSPHRIACSQHYTPLAPTRARLHSAHGDALQFPPRRAQPSHQQPRRLPASVSPTPP